LKHVLRLIRVPTWPLFHLNYSRKFFHRTESPYSAITQVGAARQEHFIIFYYHESCSEIWMPKYDAITADQKQLIQWKTKGLEVSLNLFLCDHRLLLFHLDWKNCII